MEQLSRCSLEDINADARLAYAAGRAEVLRGNREAALKAYVRVQTNAPASDNELVARLAFELGSLWLGEGRISAAEAVADWAVGLTPSVRRFADLQHLRALLAEARGQRAHALRCYRLATRASSRTLTPLTSVLAMRNQAAMAAHESPLDAVALYQMALHQIQHLDVDPSFVPGLLNGLGYALICAGDLTRANVTLREAVVAARAQARSDVEAYSEFNLSIVLELRDDLTEARRCIDRARERSLAIGLPDLVVWCDLRSVWLDLKSAPVEDIRYRLAGAVLGKSDHHNETIATLSAFVDLATGQASAASDAFAELSRSYALRADFLTAFVLELWQAAAAREARGDRYALPIARRSLQSGSERGYSVSPNWWMQDIVSTARDLADRRWRGYADNLFDVRARLARASPVVEIVGTQITIDGHPLEEAVWRGRPGARITRRCFELLVSAYPGGIQTDRLADLLWPEAEGDRAIQSLYGVTKEIHRVLSRVPGVRLVSLGGTYSLVARAGITVSPD